MRYNLKNTVEMNRMVRVFVNGAQVDRVVECDTKEGWVKYIVVDEAGQVMFDGDEVMTATQIGEITVTGMMGQPVPNAFTPARARPSCTSPLQRTSRPPSQ